MSNDTRTTVDELFIEYYDFVLNYAFRLIQNRADAEDISQQVWESVYKNWDRFKDNNLRAWLRTITKNHVINLVRKRNRKPEWFADVSEGSSREGWGFENGAGDMHGYFNSQPSTLESLDAAVARRNIDPKIAEAIQRTPKEFRAALVLYHFYDCSYKQISAELGIPVGTVMSRLNRGRAFLRNTLESSQGD